MDQHEVGSWERFVQLWEKNDAKKKAEKGQKFHQGCGHGRTPQGKEVVHAVL